MDREHLHQPLEPFDAAIIGAGPAGSAAALYLRRSGFTVCLIEKKRFPRETVCGEFLSNEVTKGLIELGAFAELLKRDPNPITSVQLHTMQGRTIAGDLGFVAYGMKRGTFDNFLSGEARKHGVCVMQPAEATDVVRCDSGFLLRIHDGTTFHEISARRVIAAYGKQNVLDKRLQRSFIGNRSHLNGIKLHVDRRHCPGIDRNSIHIFTGPNLYCGVNCVDEDRVTICFLERRSTGTGTARDRLLHFAAEHGSFRKCFDNSFETVCEASPVHGAGNIYFGRKEAVCDGIYMTGDAAGMIAPLTGDGIGMAFEGGRLLAEVFNAQHARSLDEHAASELYRRRRNELFRRRLRIARTFQTILLSPVLTLSAMSLLAAFPAFLPKFVALTRGRSRPAVRS